MKTEAERRANKKYKKTPKGRAAAIRWFNSSKGQVANKKYRAQALQNHPFHFTLIKRRYRAKAENIPFTISLKDVSPPPKICPILNIPLSYVNKNCIQDNSATIDRIDSTKGYIPGNVAIMSNRANRIKNDGTAEEHFIIAKWILKHTTKALVPDIGK